MLRLIFIGIIVCCFTILIYALSYKAGYNQGLTDMHTLCHDIGGMMLNKENNKLIICESAGIAPQVHQ